MSLNYGTLKTRILADSHRTDLGDAKAADFVAGAEGVIARRLRAAEMSTRVTLTDSDRVTVDTGIFTLPSDFLEERIIRRSDGCKLDKKGLSELRSMAGSQPVAWYAPLSKTEIEFRGIPSTTETMELLYFARPAAFSNDADFNSLLVDHETIYIAAGRSALYEFTQDLELGQVQGQIAADAIEALNEQAGRLLGGGQPDGAYNFCSVGSR